MWVRYCTTEAGSRNSENHSWDSSSVLGPREIACAEEQVGAEDSFLASQYIGSANGRSICFAFIIPTQSMCYLGIF